MQNQELDRQLRAEGAAALQLAEKAAAQQLDDGFDPLVHDVHQLTKIGGGAYGTIYKVDEFTVVKVTKRAVNNEEMARWNANLKTAVDTLNGWFLPFTGKYFVKGTNLMTGQWVRDEGTGTCMLFMDYLKPYTFASVGEKCYTNTVARTVTLVESLIMNGLYFPDFRAGNLMHRTMTEYSCCPVLIDLETLQTKTQCTDTLLSYNVFQVGWDKNGKKKKSNPLGALFYRPLKNFDGSRGKLSDVVSEELNKAFLDYITCTGGLFAIYEFIFGSDAGIKLRKRVNLERYTIGDKKDYPCDSWSSRDELALSVHHVLGRVVDAIPNISNSKYGTLIYPVFEDMCTRFASANPGENTRLTDMFLSCTVMFNDFVTLAIEHEARVVEAMQGGGEREVLIQNIKAGFIDRACRSAPQ